ncbi:unnamed protein product [Protopolystoma xenopodis]|uniref:Uncharacterized protein n=1 Tax=Protopolystoma xenopodis TaxID=117903 RepID=A0A3S5C5P1_9PLAT|nr:unnamed protein product [Protopolystoma xenopodis]
MDAYLWSHSASQLTFYLSLTITSNFCDGLLIRLPSSPTVRLPKLYWFIRNGHHRLTTSSLDFRNPPTPFLREISSPLVNDRPLIRASPFYLSRRILVISELD